MKRVWLIFKLACLICGSYYPILAQNVDRYGVLPSILLNRSMNDQWSYSLALSSEIELFFGTPSIPSSSAKVLNLNLEPALSFDADPNFNIAAGFLIRLRNPFSETGTELRPWQQITTIDRFGKYRLRNRLRMEQRWITSSPASSGYNFDLRLRYRISSDFPLEGDRLDNSEFYMNLSLEALLMPTLKRAFYYWDGRTYLGLGYQISNGHRLETALEYRTRRITDDGDRQHFLFFRTIWIVRFNQ